MVSYCLNGDSLRYGAKVAVARPQWNIGYTTRSHLCIDLDNTSLPKTLRIAKILIHEYPELGDCLIIQSSCHSYEESLCHQPLKLPYIKVRRNSYHLIFDNFIDYEESCKIIETLAHLDVLSKEFIRIRQMRNDMTLRVSETVCMDYVKKAPKMVGYISNVRAYKKGEGISLYLSLLKSYALAAACLNRRS